LHKRLAMTLTLLIALPLAIVFFLATKIYKFENLALQNQYQELLMSRLDIARAKVSNIISLRQQALQSLLAHLHTDSRSHGQLLAKVPWLDHLFVVQNDGRIIIPKLTTTIRHELDFLQRVQNLFLQRAIFLTPKDEATTKKRIDRHSTKVFAEGLEEDFYAWYWQRGLEVIYWQKFNTGETYGGELSRARLLADVMNELSEQTFVGMLPQKERIELVDARGEVLYVLGYATEKLPRLLTVEKALARPLESWKLRYTASLDYLSQTSVPRRLFSLFASGLAFVIVFLILGLYFFRENSRSMREAKNRVNFVNQVSHELKTPLTNIRMYAELLQEGLLDTDAKAKEHAEVIVSESARLSRLIGNVLTFASHERNQYKLRKTRGVIDYSLEYSIKQFHPMLLQKNIKTILTLQATIPCCFDRDILGQIITNLVSNVEKYAATGHYLAINTTQKTNVVTIRVIDRGPGIATRDHERIFKPFVRLDDSLTAKATGAGIGLTLARNLARLHGGDLVCETTHEQPGASFKLTLLTACEHLGDGFRRIESPS